jgi:hypothetical protein
MEKGLHLALVCLLSRTSWTIIPEWRYFIFTDNISRHLAYTKMLSNGFRIDMLGVAMQKGNDEGYNRPDTYIIDDWR